MFASSIPVILRRSAVQRGVMAAAAMPRLGPSFLAAADAGQHSKKSVRFLSMSEKELNKRLDGFQDLFVEARLSIEDCNDAAETTYFDEEADAAKEAVDEAVKEFETLINDIEDQDQKNRVLRGNGLKVEQLKGELEMALNGGHH